MSLAPRKTNRARALAAATALMASLSALPFQARAEAPRAAARAAHVVACAEIASVSHRPSRGLARPARTAESHG